MQEHLARILQSPSFQGSRRCQQFLQYVVDKTLAGDLDALKERVVGAAVFERPADYETSADAIVRVKANEVRKRLAQYYQDSGAADALRIELPAGSYIPTLSWNGRKLSALGLPDPGAGAASKGPVEAPARNGEIGRTSWKRWAIAAGLGLLLAAAFGLWRMMPSRPAELESFWAPIVGSSEPVMICMSVRDDYVYSRRLSEALTAGAANDGYHLDLRLQRDDVVRIPDGQMSLQSLRAVLFLAMFLTQRGTQVQFRTPAEVSFDDIRHRSAVLVGWFYNPWATQLSQELRYRFESVNSGSRAISWIRDAKAPNDRKWQVDGVWPYHAQPVDYAIVSRVFDPSSQRVTVSAAGMSRFGAQVAGEFLTSPQYWKPVGTEAPRGWERMNCQIIIETKLIGVTPGPPKVVATHFW